MCRRVFIFLLFVVVYFMFDNKISSASHDPKSIRYDDVIFSSKGDFSFEIPDKDVVFFFI